MEHFNIKHCFKVIEIWFVLFFKISRCIVCASLCICHLFEKWDDLVSTLAWQVFASRDFILKGINVCIQC